jgi:hypothetical protein
MEVILSLNYYFKFSIIKHMVSLINTKHTVIVHKVHLHKTVLQERKLQQSLRCNSVILNCSYLTPHPHVVPRLSISAAILPLPFMPS